MLYKKAYFLYNKLENLFEKDRNEDSFLIFFRVMISLIALIEIISLTADLPLFFSSTDTLIPQELMYLQSVAFKYLYPFYEFIEAASLTTSFYKTAVPLYILTLLFLLLGLFTRYAAFIALVLQLLIFRSFSHFNYGYDYFLTMSLFYCFVFPVGKYFSVDSKLFKGKKGMNFNYRRVLQLHLAIAYFFSGIAKALDIGWWNGNSVWKALASVDNTFYSLPPLLLTVAGIGTVLIELLYPFLVFKKITRKYAVTSIILMHASIAIMMELYAFSAMMIVWNIAAYGNLILKKKPKYVETV